MIWDLLIHPSNIVFSVSLLLCLCIGVLELILLMFGGSSSFIDQFLPDSLTDVDHADVSMDHADNLFTQFLEWLYWKSTFTSLVDYFPNCLFTHWFNYSRCFFQFY